MCDMWKRKSSGYRRSRNKLRTVTTSKWELPLPGSKSYWDKICDELEQRKEHVSGSYYAPSSSPDALKDPCNVMLNCDESSSSKLNNVVEPIVKISPPTPMRMIPRRPRFTITDDSLSSNERDTDLKKDNLSMNSNLLDGFNPVNVDGKKDAKLYEISVCMTEFLKTNNVQTKKSCQLHKNAEPLKIFDDNLKRFLPKREIKFKSPSTRVTPMSSGEMDLSKFHRSKSCPFRRQSVSQNRAGFGISLIENRNKISTPLKRFATEDHLEKKFKGRFDQFLKVPESSYANLHGNTKYETLNKKSKSKILMSNLNYMLSIPKLDHVSLDQHLLKFNDNSFSEDAAMNLDSQQQIHTISTAYDTQVNVHRSGGFDVSKLETASDENFKARSTCENLMPNSTESLKPSSSNFVNLPRLSDELSIALKEQTEQNDQGVGKKRVGTLKLQDQLEKDFLTVPKLRAISSYPSFSKLTSGDSVEAEESEKPIVHGLTESILPQNLENSAQQTKMSNKRDFLKVPKLSMMSSYPSFTSLIPDSLDGDDNASGASELISKRMGHDNSGIISVSSNLTDKITTPSLGDERNTNHKEEAGPSESSSPTERPKRRQSLKDSVRYAYRALKFITPNKNLDFQPQSYHPPQKSGSSSESGESSRGSKYSKFEPTIKLLTYEDIIKGGPIARTISSSTYGTIRSRLRQDAFKYLGSKYMFLSSKNRPATVSATIRSSTRSTSGPTMGFQQPVFERPSENILKKLPKMSIFPRKKYDKCFACLHKTFEEPVKCRRELPLATLNAVVKEPSKTLSESESSSISIPEVKELIESQSDYEDNWTDLLRNAKKLSMLDKTEWKSSKGLLRTNIDLYRSRQSLAQASEESQSLKSDSRIENLRKNLSSKESIASNTHPKPLSLSSEHSKPSSLSGHSSESEEPQVQAKPTVPTSQCFVSPYAPLHWAPSLDPLKSLKFRKPVSMHGRAVSITKTEDDSTSEDNANDYRSTRKETKLNNASARKVGDKNQDNLNGDSSGKKSGDKSSLVKQSSIVAKIITSQLSTIANLAKRQSEADLLSNDREGKNEIRSAPGTDVETTKETIVESQSVEASLQDHQQQMLNSKPNLHSVYSSNECPEAQSVGRLLTKPVLPQIAEQLIENGSPMDQGDSQDLVVDKSIEKHSSDENNESVSETDISTKFQELEQCPEESQDFSNKTCDIYSSERVIQVLEKCVEEERTPFEMLEALNAVAAQNDPFTSKKTMSNPETARSARIAKNLIKLLVDSKKYLNPDTFSPHLQFSSQQTPLCNPRQLRRVLPAKTYNLVARILGMPEIPVDESFDRKLDFKSGHQAKDPFKIRHTRNKDQAPDSSDMIVHPSSSRGGRRIIINEDDFEYPQRSPYALFILKPRRKAINWRPLTERDMLGYDPEATLNMRAARVTNKICQDFCEWLRGLGGGHSEDVDEEVLKDMFQIEFTAEACRTMQILIQEIPMVPIAVALARNTPGAGELALTRRHLIRDAKAESMPKKIIGFGSALPQDCRFLPPTNRVNERWLECENVPQDLETMETVWKGITYLDSVKGFLAWIKAHPGVKPPKILTEAFARKEALLRHPSTEDMSGHIELEMDEIESLKVGDVEWK